MRSLEEIHAGILALEKETEGLCLNRGRRIPTFGSLAILKCCFHRPIGRPGTRRLATCPNLQRMGGLGRAKIAKRNKLGQFTLGAAQSGARGSARSTAREWIRSLAFQANSANRIS